MIYLKNNTILQELYIPRQDYISNTTGSSGTYAEGYADGYESGYTSGSTDGFDSGYTEGYSSGETHQKGLLTSTEFTENGEYEREDGWSAVTINVSGSMLEGKEIVVSEDITVVTPDSGYGGFSAVTVDATEYGQTNYDSGFDDGFEDGYASGSSEGYDSGYTSGETHQKSLLVSTAITENGQYTRENGYSAITVNVPTGTSYNIEENRPFTATSNGDYTITPSTASTTVNAHLVNNRYVISIDFNGYPSGYFNVLTIKSDNDNEYINVYYSGHMPYHNSIGWISDPVSYEQKSSTQLILHISNANANYRWEKNSGFLEPYDAMSAVSLNVNVPMPNIETNKEFTATTNGYYWVAPTSGSVSINDRFDSDDDCYYITATTSGYPSVGRYNLFYIEDEFDSSKGQIDVYIDNGYLDYSDIGWDGGSIINYETGDRLVLEVRNANNAFDWVSDDDYNLKYDAMNGLGVIVEVPQTGHTDQELQDAYDSGYTSGENDVISTFSSITITKNGQYGDSAHPMSSITVNVPQSGGSGVKYVEYIETDNTQIGWDTGYNIGTDIDARIYLDFMPISGNGYGDYWFAYYGDGEEYVLFRRAGNSSPIGFMFGNNQSEKDYSSYSVTDDNRYLISLDKYGITDESTGTLLVSANSSLINSTNNLWLNCDGNTQQLSRCIPARYYGFRVENGNGETVLDMRPCLDGNDVPCFYDEVSQTYIYHQGSGTPVAGSVIPSPEYQSGYTDGYNSGTTDGYSDGENAVISTFTAATATTNGVYGSSANPLSSITVNVPTSGGSGYSVDQLAIRDYNINNPTINTTDIKLFAFANSNLSGMLTIGSAVTNIYAYAFSYTNISGITFPQTIVGNEYGKMVMVGYGQFEGCGNLTSVNIPSYIEFTDNARARNTYGIFEECRNLVSVNWDADRVPTYCFRYCSSLSAINLTNVTNIDDYSFMNCGSLSSITIPSSCTRIGNGAFGNCRSLNEISVLATTAPTLGVVAFTNTPNGTVHYPQGSDYSTWQNDSNLSGWTFVGDL